MFKNLTYKKKNQLLLAAVLVIAYLIYVLAISKTTAAFHDYKNLQKNVELVKNAQVMANQLEKELLQIDSRIGNNNINGLQTEQALLELLSNYCKSNKATLREFPASTNFAQGDLLIETNKFVVEGDFSTLLKLVYLLEQKNKLGKVTSVRYQYKKDVITRNMALTATVYLQNIKKQDQAPIVN